MSNAKEVSSREGGKKGKETRTNLFLIPEQPSRNEDVDHTPEMQVSTKGDEWSIEWS